MGYDLQRFQGEVDEELICPVCCGVLEEPVEAAECEHTFCRTCINDWLSRQSSCPLDTNSLTVANLRPASRIMKRLLSRLSITCNNAGRGCTLILRLDALNSHLEECEHNPERSADAPEELLAHGCVQELRNMVLMQERTISEITTEMADQTTIINELQNELRDFNRTMGVLNPVMRVIIDETELDQMGFDETELDEIFGWSNNLDRNRMIGWSDMLLMMVRILQMIIERALSELFVQLIYLIASWKIPRGFSSLEIRQNNHRIYDNLAHRRVSGKQALLVLSCDNAHMPDDVILNWA
uniref:E3 ubiquitin-protein ligase NRDP1 n=1 Tax=Glossina brevipalpis TaxID=37001 RepID=A0A1A9WZR6_9MUSC